MVELALLILFTSVTLLLLTILGCIGFAIYTIANHFTDSDKGES